MQPIEVYWQGERVGVVSFLATYDYTANVKFADSSGFFGSRACMVRQLEIPSACNLREVQGLDLMFAEEWLAKYGAPSHDYRKEVK